MNCPKCSTVMDPTGSTDAYPDCNCFVCPKCSHVEPELGSFKLSAGPSAYEAKLQYEVGILRVALKRSVDLQSHYAKLLNDYDGGNRMQFVDIESWISRLEGDNEDG